MVGARAVTAIPLVGTALAVGTGEVVSCYLDGIPLVLTPSFPSSGMFDRSRRSSAHDGPMTETPWDVALRAADVLAPESTALSNPDDVAQLGDALVSVIRQAAGDPLHVFNVGLNLAVALAQVPPKTLTHWLSDADTVPPGTGPEGPSVQ